MRSLSLCNYDSKNYEGLKDLMDKICNFQNTIDAEIRAKGSVGYSKEFCKVLERLLSISCPRESCHSFVMKIISESNLHVLAGRSSSSGRRMGTKMR